MNHWGRIFFEYDAKDRLSRVWGQPLHSHVDNCVRLLERFDDGYFHSHTRNRLLRATALHDEGKKETFRIYAEENNKLKKGKKGGKRKPGASAKLIYSFAGHRFRVPEDDPYVAALIRGHHEFSVELINRERAKLPISEKQSFADDLYLLCMADHIEADLAVKTVENKSDNPRNFMDFVTARIQGTDREYTVIPWPFAPDGFEMEIELWELPLSELKSKTPEAIQTALNEQRAFERQTITISLRRT